MLDAPLEFASKIVASALEEPSSRPLVRSFFDPATYTVTHVVRDPRSSACAIIDSVLDYDPASGRTMNASAREVIDYVKSESLEVQWLLETHAHADHLSAAPLLQKELVGSLLSGAKSFVSRKSSARSSMRVRSFSATAVSSTNCFRMAIDSRSAHSMRLCFMFQDIRPHVLPM